MDKNQPGSEVRISEEIYRRIPELLKVESHITEYRQSMPDLFRSSVLAYSRKENLELPIYALEFGSTDPNAPVLGWTGGVHGIERIGAEVVIALMNTLSELLLWDAGTRELLKHIRVFFVPIVNPIGVLNHTRSNPNGIDLMRNAPIEGSEAPLLVGGHRLGNFLPWYRGPMGSPMEVESRALVDYVTRQISKSPASIVVDVHSGFGMRDRLWFPYSRTIQPFPGLPNVGALYQLFQRTYPHHFYIIEPQSTGYTINGDLWDYIYDLHRDNQGKTFVPLCLEMGSWNWVKKNPWQLFTLKGPFNPIVEHRQRRTLRRHNTLFEFLLRSVRSYPQWAGLTGEQKLLFEKLAMQEWYGVKSKYGKQQKESNKHQAEGSSQCTRWVLLRGLARGSEHWVDFPEILKAKLGSIEIETLDIPGNGVFNKEKSPLSLDGYVDFLRARSRLLKEGPIRIFGVSLGAMIAINWATRFPDEVDGLVLSCTSSARSPFFRRLSWSQYPFVLKSFLIRDPEERERTILEMIARNHSRINLYLKSFVDYAKRLPINRLNVLRQLLAARKFKLPKKPKVPVVLLGAWGDQFVSPRCTLDIAEYWKVSPIMHPWGGHDVVIDDPAWLADQAQRLDTLTSQARHL